MRAARALVALTLLLSISGCASVTPIQTPGAASASLPPWPSDTSFGRLFAQVGADGSVSKDLALQAFSTVIAPLPGVPATTGGAPNDEERADGTFAISWLMPYIDQLTAEQRAVVDSVLTPPPTAIEVPPQRPIAAVGPAIVPPPPAVAADDKSKPYTDAIAAAESIIASRLHRSLQAHIFFDFGTAAPSSNPNAGDTLAFAYPLGLAGPNLFCGVRATPALQGASQARINVTMAHEVFHCFQFERMPDHGRSSGLSWIVEGQAEWAGEDVAGPGQDGAGWWTHYLASPRTPLYARTYDAVGFYEHLAETGTSPWSIFDAMLANVTDSTNAFKAAGAVADNFLDTWASGVFRVQGLPAAWYAHERWNVPGNAPFTNVDAFLNGSQVPVVATALTLVDTRINSSADVTQLVFEGHVRLHTGSQEIAQAAGTMYLCTQKGPNACKCPEGYTYNGPPLGQSDGVIWLAATGSLSGSQANVSGHNIKEFCEPPQPTFKRPKPKPNPRGGPNPCAKGCGGSVGDPHMATIDQKEYDLQAAGEFTLLRSADGSMEIQARQVPFPGDIPDVSINSALAWKVNGHRIGMYAGESQSFSLTLDGQPQDTGAIGTIDLGAGAALSVFTDGIEVAYADGTLTTAFFHGGEFADALDIQVAPSDAFRSQAVGLLAPIADGSELPQMPDGSILPLSTDRATRFDQRYRQLSSAWHVTDQTSLFDYQPGESTATFDKPDFPSANVAFDIDELTLQQGLGPYQDAVNKCSDVPAEQDNFLHCVFDIMATKDPAYAQIYALIEQFQAQGPTVLDPGPETTPPPPPTPSTSLPAGFFQVETNVSLIRGATVDANGTVYVSLLDPDFAPEIASVDGTSGAPKGKVDTSGSGSLFLLAGSLWMAEDDPTGFGNCLLERFDPQTLASQAKIPIGCDISGASATPVSDGVWWLDRSTADADGKGAMVRHVDPATNAVDRSVELPFANGVLTSSASTVIFGSPTGTEGWYRLTQGSSAFVALPVPADAFALYPAGEGAWNQPSENSSSLPEADFVTASATPDKVIAIDGSLVGADENAVYVAAFSDSVDSLVRYVDDGSAPTVTLSGASLTTAAGDQELGYFDNDPLVFANQRALKLWIVRDWPDAGTTSVVGQTAQLP